jgi:hypothetical protein
MRSVVALLVALALLTVSTEVGQAQTPTPARMDVTLDHDTRILSWQDVAGEASYRITGVVAYRASNACDLAQTPGPGVYEEVGISSDVPADTTSFTLPPPANASADTIQNIQVAIYALNSAGDTLASGAYGFIADPAPCPPQPASPPVDVILPDSGDASEGAASLRAPVVQFAGLLAMLCLICLAVVMRRRRS